MNPSTTEKPRREIRPPARKTAPGDFFANSNKFTYKIRPDAQHLCRVQPPTTTAATSGVFYYGLRYYSPDTGRWLSRDPIGEAGGLNLYGFVGNDGVNRLDYLGMRFFGTPDQHREETDPWLLFHIISTQVSGEFSEALLRRYLFKEGDWHLTKFQVRSLVKPVPNRVTRLTVENIPGKLGKLTPPKHRFIKKLQDAISESGNVATREFPVHFIQTIAEDASNPQGGLGAYTFNYYNLKITMKCRTTVHGVNVYDWSAEGLASIYDKQTYDPNTDKESRNWDAHLKVWLMHHLTEGREFVVSSDIFGVKINGTLNTRREPMEETAPRFSF